MSLNLKTLLAPNKTTEVEFPGYEGFKLQVGYISRETLVNLRKRATKTTFTRGRTSEVTDDDLFIKLYTEAAIKGWDGLTLDIVSKLAAVDLPGKDLNELLPYTAENALDLVKASTDFDSFITDTCQTLGNFPTISGSK
jgi:hypothetical protein